MWVDLNGGIAKKKIKLLVFAFVCLFAFFFLKKSEKGPLFLKGRRKRKQVVCGARQGH